MPPNPAKIALWWLFFTCAVGLVIAVLIWAIVSVVTRRRYARTTYYQQTGVPYRKMVGDKGKYGEYLTGEKLQRLPGHHRTLFNLYLPRSDGTTTEVDLLFLHPSGIYVVESKNYGGFVFGSESDRRWTATLAGGRHKEHFFSPTRQNAGHISALLNLLPQINPNVLCSLIVFSERCELAKVPANTWSRIIVKRNYLEQALQPRLTTRLLSDDQIDWLFSWLYPQTQVDETVKTAHIARVSNLRG